MISSDSIRKRAGVTRFAVSTVRGLIHNQQFAVMTFLVLHVRLPDESSIAGWRRVKDDVHRATGPGPRAAPSAPEPARWQPGYTHPVEDTDPH